MLEQKLDEVTADQALDAAIAAAREAGTLLLPLLGRAEVLLQKSARDELLDADLLAEAAILGYLRQRFPAWGALSEERGRVPPAMPPDAGTLEWVIDGLDGSANFQHGDPTFGIAICLTSDGIPLLAVIYLPAHDELYAAVRGRGATLNGTRIAVSKTAEADRAIIHIGDFSKRGDRSVNRERLAIVGTLADAVARVRLVGSAAVDLAYVSCGRADVALLALGHPWDIEAGRLLVTEAGGNWEEVVSAAGCAYGVFSNGRLNSAISHELRKALVDHRGNDNV